MGQHRRSRSASPACLSVQLVFVFDGISLLTSSGHTMPCRRTPNTTCAAECSSAVRAFSVAYGPWPRMSTRFAFQQTSSTSLLMPRRILPTKDRSPATESTLGSPRRRFVHSTNHSLVMYERSPMVFRHPSRHCHGVSVARDDCTEVSATPTIVF